MARGLVSGATRRARTAKRLTTSWCRPRCRNRLYDKRRRSIRPDDVEADRKDTVGRARASQIPSAERIETLQPDVPLDWPAAQTGNQPSKRLRSQNFDCSRQK